MIKNDYRKQIIKRTYDFSLSVIKMTRTLPTNDLSIKVIIGQLIRSATSIGANIVEAQGSPTKKDFRNFIHHALKSSNETRYWLALLRDLVQNSNNIKLILNEAQEISKILGSIIKKLNIKI